MKYFLLFLLLLTLPDALALKGDTKCRVAISRKQWMEYENAQALIREIGIKTRNQFQAWSRSDQRPNDFPSDPVRTYKEKWVSWGQFLGTGSVHKKIFRSYESAKALVRQLGISTQKQFQEWSQSGKQPDDMPSHPEREYKEEWGNWGQFLGTNNVSRKNFRSYESAKTLVRQLGIKTKNQFQAWSRSGQRPNDFPSDPKRVYKGEWVNWGQFLGTNNVNRKNFRSYRSAKAFMRNLDINTKSQFYKWSQSDERPDDIPSNPPRTYQTEWVDWSDFLDNEKPKKRMSYKEGQRYVQGIGVKTTKEFLNWLRSDERPDDFPLEPHIVWSGLWKGPQRFLKIRWMSFKEARRYLEWEGIATKSEYRDLRESEDLIDELPSNPALVYAPYWKDWDHFLLSE